MDFSAKSAAGLYSDRSADGSWKEFCKTVLCPAGKDVADIGCGGGIYTLAFAKLGAKSVTGIDNAVQYVERAKHLSVDTNNVRFQVGTATSTGLSDASIDLVFERALIHHLSEEEQELNIQEAIRVLRKAGMLAIQDRSFENVLDNDAKHWIRSTLFHCFPELLDFERLRRPSEHGYLKMLEKHSLHTLAPVKFSEVRKSYASFSELEIEIMARKGKSILFELDDDQLKHYCHRLKEASLVRRLEEIDQWTVWRAEVH